MPVETLRRQLEALLAAWGMRADHVATTARVMLEADLCGIDSHGIAMLPLYEELRAAGRLDMTPEIRIVRDGPATGLIDGGGGLGHAPSVMAMERAIDKCAAFGLAAIGVRNSNHYGAAGIYAAMAAERGFIGMSFTAVHNASVIPTRAAEPMFGTNPIAFAAPAGRNPPFLLDMATSTVAIGKLKIADFNDRPIAEGWAMDGEGRATTDAKVGLRHRLLSPLGGTPVMSSHKGYGLGAMVEILSTILPGASYAPVRRRDRPDQARLDVGHFFMAIDPRAFREEDGFESDLDAMIDALHGARRLDPDRPVLVHGDPEREARAERSVAGIPVPESVAEAVRAIAGRAGAPFLLA